MTDDSVILFYFYLFISILNCRYSLSFIDIDIRFLGSLCGLDLCASLGSSVPQA